MTDRLGTGLKPALAYLEDGRAPPAQRENLGYVRLQILQGLKTAQSTVDIGEALRALASDWAEIESGAGAVKTGRDALTVSDVA